MVRIDCGDTGPWVWGPLLPHPLCQSKQWKWRVEKLGPGGQGLRCEGYQCNKVPGVFSSEVPTAAEDNEGDEEDGIGDVIGPDVLLDEALHLPDEREHGHSGQSHRQLQSQHQEHLPDEGLANAFVIPVGGREVLVVIVGWGSFFMIVPMLRRARVRCREGLWLSIGVGGKIGRAHV